MVAPKAQGRSLRAIADEMQRRVRSCWRGRGGCAADAAAAFERAASASSCSIATASAIQAGSAPVSASSLMSRWPRHAEFSID